MSPVQQTETVIEQHINGESQSGAIELVFNTRLDQNSYGNMAYINTEADELLQSHHRWPSDAESILPSDGDVESQDVYMQGLKDIDAEEELGSLAYKSDMIDELGQPYIPGGPIKERTIYDSSVLMMQEAEERIWKLRTGALIYDLTWSRDSVSISPEITGGRQSQHDEMKSVKFQSEKACVQHRQEQTAQVHTVRNGDGDTWRRSKIITFVMKLDIGSQCTSSAVRTLLQYLGW